jgi:hypothetical protein
MVNFDLNTFLRAVNFVVGILLITTGIFHYIGLTFKLIDASLFTPLFIM